MDSFAICAAAVLCVLASACIRTLKPELVPVLRLSFCLLIGVWVLTALRPLVAQLRSWMELTAADYTSLLLKALGIAFLSHLTAELCRDCGENTLASGVETLGKLEILTLCLPLIGSVMETVGEMLRW